MQQRVDIKRNSKNGLRNSIKYPRDFLRVIKQAVAGSITGVHTSRNVVAFTFDDGPHPEYTPRLVDVLNKYNAKATFFMVGKNAERYPDVVRYVAESGHVIANHTWDHPAVPAISRRERLRQILACKKALSPYGDKLFRPPYGFQSISSYVDVRLLGYQIVAWNEVVEDWLDHYVDQLVEIIENTLKPGSIILMHDFLYHTLADQYEDRSHLINAIDIILKKYFNSISFVTIPDLLRYGRIMKKAWFRPPNVTWLNALNNGTARQY